VLYLKQIILPAKKLIMDTKALSIRPFIGAKNFEISRQFYRDIGFEESIITPGMSLFKTATLGFYLQQAYVKDWVDNTMVFLEVSDIHKYWNNLNALNLTAKYEAVRLSAVNHFTWGSECYLHDPAGILWHIGQFNQ
jgi:hypothetical protein